jgi:CheY-like chemotaxis protein
MQRVLLADDEANVRRLLGTVLRAAGFEVTEASSGHEALALAETHGIDVLVADVVMEDMDGLALADWLVAKNASLLVVFISGYALDMDAAQRRHPHCAFLRKPFPPKTLVRTVEEMTKKREGR